MAIVEKSGSRPALKWEEFVTIKLSKREAVGLLSVAGALPGGSVLPNGLYDGLKEAIGEDLRTQFLTIEGAHSVNKELDNIYGDL